MKVAFQERKLRFREAQKLDQYWRERLRLSLQQTDESHSLSLRQSLAVAVSMSPGLLKDSVPALLGTTQSDPSGCIKTASRPRILEHPSN